MGIQAECPYCGIIRSRGSKVSSSYMYKLMGRLYDRITADAPEYYLFNDELNLLKTHGPEIARSMGFGKANKQERQDRQTHQIGPEKRWRPAKWGDTEVGKWNRGVNGEEGLGGGFDRGYDVVELGAG